MIPATTMAATRVPIMEIIAAGGPGQSPFTTTEYLGPDSEPTTYDWWGGWQPASSTADYDYDDETVTITVYETSCYYHTITAYPPRIT
jgi:hypothetical protein